MTRNWKPGDVAMVECSDGEWRRAFCGEARSGIGVAPSWMFADHSLRYVEDSIARRLVVIDLDEPKQVERLTKAFFDASPKVITGIAFDDRSAIDRLWRESMLRALREFAKASAMEPTEPKGLGAVVEDENGERYVRHGSADLDESVTWCNSVGVGRSWSRINAVRILSEGVQP